MEMMNIDMHEIAEEFRLSHWAEIIREREASGLSIKDFCRNADFKESKYFYWLKKLRKAACAELGLVPGKPTSSKPAVFAEVKLPMQHTMSPLSSMLDNNICIEAGGLRFIAGSEYPVAKLVEVIQVVSRTCC